MKTKEKETNPAAKAGRVVIRVKDSSAWGALLSKARDEHWRRLRVEIQIREWIMAGKPASLDAANAMLKARGLEDYIEAAADIEDPDLRAQAAERVMTDEGLCEFARRPGRNGVWIPSNNIKAGFKENWSVLGLRKEVRGSRGALAEGLFVTAADVDAEPSEELDWISLGDAPSGIHVKISHTNGPTGPQSSINRVEYVKRPRIAFAIAIANTKAVAEKISDDEIAATLIHFGEHGLGACRSQGFGKFDVVDVREV